MIFFHKRTARNGSTLHTHPLQLGRLHISLLRGWRSTMSTLKCFSNVSEEENLWAPRERFGIASVVLCRSLSDVEVHRKRLPRTPFAKNCRLHRPCPDAQQDPGIGVLTSYSMKRRADYSLTIEFPVEKYHIGYLQGTKVSSTGPTCGSNKHQAGSLSLRI